MTVEGKRLNAQIVPEGSIVLSEVSKTYSGSKKPALQFVSAALKSGHITGVVGPDGSGKTTLMQIMSGLILPTQGTVTVCGFDTRLYTAEIHDILGYMPQRFALYEELTVEENLTLYAKLKNVPEHQIPETFARMYHFTQLGEFKNRHAQDLSGGMKQKLGLACALLGKPKLLLLDEPSVGVDPLSRRELWNIVKGVASQDMAVVWSTSYLDEAERCDHVLLLNEGNIIYSGKPQDLTDQLNGRILKVTPKTHDRRLFLDHLMTQPGVVDGLVEGDYIRLVMKKGTFVPILQEGDTAAFTPTSPRFEDAFIDALGESPRGVSPLARMISVKESFLANPIEAIQLTKKFGEFTAAGDINFSIKQGEIFGLLGPNGAGKSTTFKMLCGLLKPTKGQALVLGMDLKVAEGTARMRIGYMAQKFSLYGHLTVYQNLAFFSGVYGLSKAKQAERIQEMLDIFDLHPFVNTDAGMLPLGFKQRLALACSVMHEPDILFLDEPTSGVDPLTRREFWMHINQMVRKGVTIMVTTHYMEEAENCDRIALIYRGRCIALGTPDSLKASVQKEGKELPSLEAAFIALIEQNVEKKEA
jgi:ABC-2 type transport system ATP-binding protein